MSKIVESPKKLPALHSDATTIWWEVSDYTYAIRPIQVASETAKTLKKVSVWQDKAKLVTMHKGRNTFPTWEKARAFALAKAGQSAERHRIALAEELQDIEKLKKLKEPTP